MSDNNKVPMLKIIKRFEYYFRFKNYPFGRVPRVDETDSTYVGTVKISKDGEIQFTREIKAN